MTEWGTEIEVNGKRPAWLRDDDLTTARSRTHNRHNGHWPNPALLWKRAGDVRAWDRVTHFRLPVDHPAYKAISQGFEPWGGGDSAPDDWDGGIVLLRGGGTVGASLNIFDWQGSSNLTVIGYKRRTDPVAVNIPNARMTATSLCFGEPFTAYNPKTHKLVALNAAETLAKRHGITVEAVYEIRGAEL